MPAEPDWRALRRSGRGGPVPSLQMYTYGAFLLLQDFCWNCKGTGRIIFTILSHRFRSLLLVRSLRHNQVNPSIKLKQKKRFIEIICRISWESLRFILGSTLAGAAPKPYCPSTQKSYLSACCGTNNMACTHQPWVLDTEGQSLLTPTTEATPLSSPKDGVLSAAGSQVAPPEMKSHTKSSDRWSLWSPACAWKFWLLPWGSRTGNVKYSPDKRRVFVVGEHSQTG